MIKESCNLILLKSILVKSLGFLRMKQMKRCDNLDDLKKIIECFEKFWCGKAAGYTQLKLHSVNGTIKDILKISLRFIIC